MKMIMDQRYLRGRGKGKSRKRGGRGRRIG